MNLPNTVFESRIPIPLRRSSLPGERRAPPTHINLRPDLSPVPPSSDSDPTAAATGSAESFSLEDLDQTDRNIPATPGATHQPHQIPHQPILLPIMSSLDIPLPKLNHPHEVDEFDKRFKEVNWKLRETDDARKAELFEMCLGEGSSAETWWETLCPATAKESWTQIRTHLIATFRTKESDQKHLQKLQAHKLSDADAQDEDKRNTWIQVAKALCKKIAETYTCDEAKANIIKANIGEETRVLMNVKANTVQGVCEALRVLDEHQVGIIRKRVDTANVKESVAALTTKVNSKDAEIARLLKLLSNVNLTTTTAHQGSTTAHTGSQTATTSTQLVVRPKTNAMGRTQNYRVYTAEQKARLAAWKSKNGENVTYGCDLPLVGADPLGSNECNGCGTKGHRAVDCQFDKLDLLEQKLRKLHNDRARAERIARNATTYMTPTAIEPVHFTDDVEETGGSQLRIEEGNGGGQE